MNLETVADWLDQGLAPIVRLIEAGAGGADSRLAIALVCGSAMLGVLFVYMPLIHETVRYSKLVDSLRKIEGSVGLSREARRERLNVAFAESPFAARWKSFLERWLAARLQADPEDLDAAPVRLATVFDERPLMEPGGRRNLVSAMPGLMLALGVLATIAGFGGVVSLDASGESTRVDMLSWQLALALRTAFWGLFFSIAASMASRWIEGRYQFLENELDLLSERAYRAISPSELSSRVAQAQHQGTERLHDSLFGSIERFNRGLEETLERIQDASFGAADEATERQRESLTRLLEELRAAVHEGVEIQLSELRQVLHRTIEHQDAVNGGLSLSFERMSENSIAHREISKSLSGAADSVRGASEHMEIISGELEPLLTEIRHTSVALKETVSALKQVTGAAIKPQMSKASTEKPDSEGTKAPSDFRYADYIESQPTPPQRNARATESGADGEPTTPEGSLAGLLGRTAPGDK